MSFESPNNATSRDLQSEIASSYRCYRTIWWILGIGERDAQPIDQVAHP